MIKFIILPLLLASQTLLASSPLSTTLVSQGGASVTLDDMDGFAYKIPKDKRNGFFYSIPRIDKALSTLLKMKHIVNYANSNNLLDTQLIKQNVQSKLLNLAPVDTTELDSMQQQQDYSKYVRYLELIESYKQFKGVIKGSIKPEDVEELAYEKYITNKSVYVSKESRDLQVLSVVFNDENRQQQKIKAEKILKEITKSKAGFKDYAMTKLVDQVDVELSLEMKGFHNNPDYGELSRLVYKQKQTGIIKKPVEFNSRFSIVNVLNINPSKQLSFDEVKKYIIEDLAKQKGKERFSEILLKITQDPINIDKEVFEFIKQRYTTKPQKTVD